MLSKYDNIVLKYTLLVKVPANFPAWLNVISLTTVKSACLLLVPSNCLIATFTDLNLRCR